MRKSPTVSKSQQLRKGLSKMVGKLAKKVAKK